MRFNTITSRVLVLGAALAVTACGKKDDDAAAGAGDSAVAGSATMTGDTAAGSMGSTTGAAGADLSNLTEPNIMSMIGLSNAGEIATSKAVQGKAKNAGVKAYAADMIKEHTAMQGEADRLAKKLNVTPQPPAAADAMQKMVDSVTAALGGTAAAGAAGAGATASTDADRQYMDFQVRSHQQTLDNLQRFQTQAQNAELKALIEKSIPKVQAHLQRAQDIQGKLGSAS